MRTTVEITERQRQALTTLAGRRGLRGFSQLVQEALDGYLEAQQGDDLRALLALEGSLSEAEAAEVHRRVEQAWSSWRSSS